MPLSVERLKDLAAIMEFGNPGTMFEVSEDVASALRELIAIKEAEPVAWTDTDNLRVLSWADESSMFSEHHVDGDIPLIRKPE